VHGDEQTSGLRCIGRRQAGHEDQVVSAPHTGRSL
jgi:hypothetical protein